MDTETILLLNNLSSVAAAVACWWLTHNYAAAGYPFGRVIATLCATLGMSIMLTAFARNLYIDPSPFLIVSKVVLTALALALARRTSINAHRMTRAPDTPERPA